MNIPPLYIGSGVAIAILVITLMKIFTPQATPEFVEIEDTPDEPKPLKPLPDLITIYLVPEDPIPGKTLLAFLMDHGLQFSEKQKIFHALSSKRVQFCVATLSSPGTFDLNEMITDEFSGLSFFMQPKASQQALDDFDALCQVLFEAKETFHAHLQSEHKSDISLEQLRELRDQISQHLAH